MGLKTALRNDRSSRKLYTEGRLLLLFILFMFTQLYVTFAHKEKSLLEGDIVDLTGRPVHAKVSIEDYREVVETDGFGHYVIEFVPGSFIQRIDSPGFVTLRKKRSIFGGGRIRAATIEMVSIPPRAGLWLPEKNGYQEVEQIRVSRSTYSLYNNEVILEMSGHPMHLCSGTKVVFRSTEGHAGLPTPWRVSDEDELLDQGPIMFSQLPGLHVEAVDADVFVLTFQRPIRLALVPVLTDIFPTSHAAWYLKIHHCSEAP